MSTTTPQENKPKNSMSTTTPQEKNSMSTTTPQEKPSGETTTKKPFHPPKPAAPIITLISAVTKADIDALKELLSTSEKANDLSESINSKQSTLIHFAAEKGDSHLYVLEELVKHRTLRFGNLDAVSSGDYTALHFAVRAGCKEAVLALIKNGAFVSAKDKFGNTPLHNAVESADSDMIKLLLSHGAGFHVKNKDKKTPKAMAISRAKNYINRSDDTLNVYQLEQKEKYNSVLEVFELYSTPTGADPKENIFYAASTGSCDLIKSITAATPDVVNMISHSGHSPLYLAVKNGHAAAVNLLLSLGASPRIQNTFGTTPLHKAIENKDLNCFAALLAHGTVLFVKNRQGKLPIDLACDKGLWDFVSALAERHIEEALQAGYFVKSIVSKLNHILRQATREGEIGLVLTLFRTRYAVTVNECTPSGWTGLHLAIKHQNLNLLKIYLKNRADPNIVLAEGFTALHMAAELPIEDLEKSKYLQILIQSKSDVNAVTLSGYTALHMVVKKGHTHSVRVLLEGKADPNIPHPYLSVPYYIAVKDKNYEIAELLVKYGSAITGSNLPLLHAIRCGHIGIAIQMIEQGMDPNVEDPKTGWTALGLAVIKDSVLELIQRLVEFKADINKQNKAGFTPLHSACSLENEPVVKELLDHGADPNIPNISQFTPLHTALTLKNAPIVRLLLRGGANPTTPFPSTGTLPSAVISKLDDPTLIAEFLESNQDVDPGIRLCTAVRSGHPRLVKYLIEEKSINLNNEYHDNSYGDDRRPLSYTIKKNNTVDMEMIKFLVSQGANPGLSLSSSSKRTLLHMALDMKHVDLFNYLIAQEYVDLNAREKNNWTPLNTALGTKDIKSAETLIKLGADVNIANDKKVYPIHQAISLDNMPLFELLLEKGADVNVQTYNRMTPLDFALREKKWSMAKLLIEKGANKLKRIVGRSSWTLMHFIAATRGVDPFVVSESLRLMVSQPDEFPINQVDNKGWTALHLAVKNFNKEAVVVLVQGGADVTILTKKKWSPLHTIGKLVIKTVKKKNVKTVFSENILQITDILIDALKGTPIQDGIDQKGENGFTPLDIAIFNQNTQIIDKLQNNGAKTSVSSKPMGIYHAAEIGNADMIKSCNDSPDINKGKGSLSWTPLHIAAWFGHDKAITALININADPALQDTQGRTPLHLAVERRRRRVVRSLMTSKPEIASIKDKKGYSVLDDTPKSDKSLVAVISKFLETTHKPGQRTDRNVREARQKTRVAESRLDRKEAATARGRGRTAGRPIRERRVRPMRGGRGVRGGRGDRPTRGRGRGPVATTNWGDAEPGEGWAEGWQSEWGPIQTPVPAPKPAPKAKKIEIQNENEWPALDEQPAWTDAGNDWN